MKLLALIVASFVLAQVFVSTAQASSSIRRAVCHYFTGSYCAQALRVSWCESHWSPYARNGQYLGLFQMGSYARARYGHGPDAWSQARAAYRYFIASGRDWSPWSCRPW